MQDTDGIATLNPFRYRSYYFDEETGLYYLQTRYYDPELGRFISADSIEYLDPETLGGLNLYAYCGSNPVMAVDSTGSESVPWWQWLISGVQLLMGIAMCFIPGGQGLGASLIVGGTLGLLTNALSPELGRIIGGVSSISNGMGAISTGSSIIGLGPVGLVAGIALIIVGAATMIFGSNEIATVITGNNYIQQKTGMSDFEYGLVYNGLNLASSIGQILGDCYFLHKTRTVRIGKNNEIDGYRYYDIAGEPLFDFDYAHGGKINYNHFHGWGGPDLTNRTKDHLSYLRLLWWLFRRNFR